MRNDTVLLKIHDRQRLPTLFVICCTLKCNVHSGRPPFSSLNRASSMHVISSLGYFWIYDLHEARVRELWSLVFDPINLSTDMSQTLKGYYFNVLFHETENNVQDMNVTD